MLIEREQSSTGTPQDVARTIEILAPAGSPIELVTTAFKIAALHHAALERRERLETASGQDQRIEQ